MGTNAKVSGAPWRREGKRTDHDMVSEAGVGSLLLGEQNVRHRELDHVVEVHGAPVESGLEDNVADAADDGGLGLPCL